MATVSYQVTILNEQACVAFSFPGVIALSRELENLAEGLKELSLSRVSMTAKGAHTQTNAHALAFPSLYRTPHCRNRTRARADLNTLGGGNEKGTKSNRNVNPNLRSLDPKTFTSCYLSTT